MRKEFEISGCIEVQSEVTKNEFIDAFLEFLESKDWCFGGGVREIQDGFYSPPKESTVEGVVTLVK